LSAAPSGILICSTPSRSELFRINVKSVRDHTRRNRFRVRRSAFRRRQPRLSTLARYGDRFIERARANSAGMSSLIAGELEMPVISSLRIPRILFPPLVMAQRNPANLSDSKKREVKDTAAILILKCYPILRPSNFATSTFPSTRGFLTRPRQNRGARA